MFLKLLLNGETVAAMPLVNGHGPYNEPQCTSSIPDTAAFDGDCDEAEFDSGLAEFCACIEDGCSPKRRQASGPVIASFTPLPRAPSTVRPLARDHRVLIGWPSPLGLVWTGACYWGGVGGFIFNSPSPPRPPPLNGQAWCSRRAGRSRRDGRLCLRRRRSATTRPPTPTAPSWATTTPTASS